MKTYLKPKKTVGSINTERNLVSTRKTVFQFEIYVIPGKEGQNQAPVWQVTIHTQTHMRGFHVIEKRVKTTEMFIKREMVKYVHPMKTLGKT